MIMVMKLLVIVGCGLFFGAALYISLVQHPAALETGSEFAARFFRPMYRRAAVFQASPALVASVAALAAWLRGAGIVWLAPASFMSSVVLFTLFVIKPVNEVLLKGEIVGSEINTRPVRWGQLHRARTIVSGAAFALCLVDGFG
jgi:hypothetical protein